MDPDPRAPGELAPPALKEREALETDLQDNIEKPKESGQAPDSASENAVRSSFKKSVR